MIEQGFYSIDYAKMKRAISEKASSLLSDISEENLRYFSNEVKTIAEGTLDDYVFKVFNLYSEGAKKIDDTDILLAFTDYREGYQGKMDSWKRTHPIEIKQQKVSIPRKPIVPEQKVKSVHVLSIGTVIATGLFIFSNAWIALAAELLTLVIASRQHIQKKKITKQYQWQLDKYKMEIEKLKSDLIQGLTKDIESWLNLAVQESSTILKSFNLV